MDAPTDSAAVEPVEQDPDEVPPAALLELPADWFNILEDQADAVAARRRYEHLLERVFPMMEPQARAQGVEAMLAWRETIWTAGFLTHGIMTVPATEDSGALFWQVLITLVKVPKLHQDLDAGAMLARLMRQKIEDVLHVEHFETRLGLGAGFVAHARMAPQNVQNAQNVRNAQKSLTMSGTAAAISCPQGGGWSILVMGISHDPDQAAQLGWLVGQIAGHSTLEEPAEQAEAESVSSSPATKTT